MSEKGLGEIKIASGYIVAVSQRFKTKVTVFKV